MNREQIGAAAGISGPSILLEYPIARLYADHPGQPQLRRHQQ
ncbi:hypothetical protein ACWF94_14675 [Streptomyces sp. NPDC055078]